MMFILAAAEHNFSFFDFENNLVNWLVLVVLLIWLMSRILPPVLKNRKETIETALSEASAARAEGLAFLAQQHQKMENAEKDADKILLEAKQIADKMRLDMEAQALKDAADLREKIEQEIANERQLAITELRAAAARASIVLTEASLAGAMTDSIKAKLMSQFLKQVEET